MINFMIYEVFPFIGTVKANRKLKNKLKTPQDSTDFKNYIKFNTETLIERIKEEHNREVSIINKTEKFVTLLTIIITIISSDYFKIINNGLVFIMVFLFLFLALIPAIHSFSTRHKFGYGTYFKDIERKSIDGEEQEKSDCKNNIVENLVCQETSNTIISNNNQLCYLNTRNAFIILSLYIFWEYLRQFNFWHDLYNSILRMICPC